jgi:hypothetical protein
VFQHNKNEQRGPKHLSVSPRRLSRMLGVLRNTHPIE